MPRSLITRSVLAVDQIVEPTPLPGNGSCIKSLIRDLGSSSNGLCHRMRVLSESENARAILLAVGVAAFCFAVIPHFGEYHGEHQSPVEACVDFCSNSLANATPATSSSEVTPIIGDVQNDNKYRDHAPDTDRLHGPAISTKGSMAGIVTSRKTGARARVDVAHGARFQAYIDDLENNHGARILFMGGIRPGRCSRSGLHPCGKALDVCQLRRGVVDPRCNLPSRRTLAQIASTHGLFEGGRWCNSDYGHVQLGTTAADCGDQRTRIVRRQIAPGAVRNAAIVSFE